MFEKEAEEYKKLPKWKGKIFMKDEETCYKDGATFGYNKAKEELKAQIADLEKENAELKKRNGELAGQRASLERWFGEAKAIIRNLLRVTYGEGWNYSLDVKVKAEQFLKETVVDS